MMTSRGLFVKINLSKGSNFSEESLDTFVKLINGYDQVVINFDEDNVHKTFEILRQMTFRNLATTLLVYSGKKTPPEGYDEVTIEL